eukprot:CAMPEP_0115878534 /NCGR_PEP_ID=MMETSP0287-20121206/26821_1 /TAXON_ID=412157 /ORGANISM="Chrysochromulina rotalis, Strain UIO044" /LENGTH=204 /DNA_ID=CAMNT_0003334149 /DNA_START=266 /DNA_END=877 /DNA_ORIENTATION=+
MRPSSLAKSKRQRTEDKVQDAPEPTFLSKLLRFRRPMNVYHMDSTAERKAMVDCLWTGEYTSCIGRFTAANPDFLNLLGQQCVVDVTADATCATRPRRPDALQSIIPRYEPVFMTAFRCRSQKMVPLETAALSVRFLHYRVPRPVWETVGCFSHLVMSREWTEKVCELALQRDPGPPYETVAARTITAAVFDNFTMKVGYGSYA